MRFHVEVRYEAPPPLPSVPPDPAPPQEAIDAFACMGVCRVGDVGGSSTITVTVEAEDSAAARVEGVRLSDLLAQPMGIGEGKAVRVAAAQPVSDILSQDPVLV